MVLARLSYSLSKSSSDELSMPLLWPERCSWRQEQLAALESRLKATATDLEERASDWQAAEGRVARREAQVAVTLWQPSREG